MLPYSYWLNLPLITRQKIAAQFDIPKIRPTHVSDNKVVDDGYDVHAIENALTLEAIQTTLKSTEQDYLTLFATFIDFMEERYKLPIEEEVIPSQVQVIAKKRGRPFKKK